MTKRELRTDRPEPGDADRRGRLADDVGYLLAWHWIASRTGPPVKSPVTGNSATERDRRRRHPKGP